jgi:hypothetical protein
MEEYLPRARAFLKKHFLCMIDLKEHGLEAHVPPAMHDGVPYAATIIDGKLGWVAAKSIKRSRDVHHGCGRLGDNLLNELTWWAVSRKNHRKVHDNPGWARENGYIK